MYAPRFPITVILDTPITVCYIPSDDNNMMFRFPSDIENIDNVIVPKVVFIVPQRDREMHRSNFIQRMKYLMEDIPDHEYAIYFVNQCDARSFNRGAIKNIGFMAMRHKFPNDYHNMTFVFNDIDTTPIHKNLLDYKTIPGKIKHFCGFKHSLGGIFSITGGDFERINGFINLWAWGYEDNHIQVSANIHNIEIDRSVFYSVHDSNIEYLLDSPIRVINRSEFDYYINRPKEGVDTLTHLNYVIDENQGYINVYGFNAGHIENESLRVEYNLNNGVTPFLLTPVPKRRIMSMIFHS